MYKFLLGVVFGIYIEQQYAMPDVVVQLQELEKFLIANYKLEYKNDKNDKNDT